ncbi:ORF6N domain-containing protein [Pasteurellaceae bacterium TAE3-ERU1]|nr:ORF6N domain-containing protein [Pasteurellaceae bacterium TAE3-ERU1]
MAEIQLTSELGDMDIRHLIYTFRGKQVMLDSDLARLYRVETKNLTRQVRRNIERFPEAFCFQLTEDEFEHLRCQIATSKNHEENQRGGRRYAPYVFTEQGIAMLSAVLKSDTAVKMSIAIINTFVEMRRFLVNNQLLFDRLSEIEVKQLEYQRTSDERFARVFKQLDQQKPIEQKIFFEGQIYDAYSLLCRLISNAKKHIDLIDNYVDKQTLDILSQKGQGVSVTLVTRAKTALSSVAIEKFNQQYPTLTVQQNNQFHDRFLILDNETLYHIGASLKDAGKKTFAINKIESEQLICDILNTIHRQDTGH